MNNTLATRHSVAVLTAALALAFSGCGGSGSTTPIVTPTLSSISVAPLTPAITVGATQPFSATGNYGDGSTRTLTTSVMWTSSDTSVATVSNSTGSQGVATGVGTGTSKITASDGSIFSTATLTVNSAVSQPEWSQEGPLARLSHSTVYDSATQQMIVFGGQVPSGSNNLNDVWLATTSLTPSATLTWTVLQPTGTKPSARFGHIAAYDQNTNRMLLFGGGEGQPGPCTNDTWVLDGANGKSAANWIELNPSGSAPSARVHHTGAYDSASNTLTVFGGSDCATGFFNDVWVLSNANGEGGTPTWNKLTPSGSPPAARESSTAIYDSVSHIMTIYGGDAGGTPFGDVWVLSNANGQNGTPVWSQLSPTGTAPAPRTAHTSVYDRASNLMNVFAGSDGTTTLADNWILSSPNGLGGTPAWTQLVVPGTAPNVQFHTAVYDEALNNMYVFAGTSTGNKLQSSNHMFTLTGANGVSGSLQWLIAGPPVRYSQSAFLDSSGSLFIWAGQHSSNIDFNDYQRDSGVLTSPTSEDWTKLTTSGTSPAARLGHTGVYDSATNRMMVFGGEKDNPTTCLNDYWVLTEANASGGTPGWTSISPSGTAPSARMRHASVYDPVTNALIIFGGFNCSSTYLNDVWRLSNANASGTTPAWTHVVPSGTPPSVRQRSAAVYDEPTNSMILFGGDSGTTEFNDVWVLSHANGLGGTPAWAQLTVSGGPSPRTGHSAIYDAQNSRIVIYGGLSAGSVFSDVWILSNANGVAGSPGWTQLTPASPGPPRYDHSAVFDPATNQMIIFGGVITSSPLSPDANVFSLTGANGLQ